MKNHYLKSLLIFLLLPIVLVNYQNCGSSAGGGEGVAQLAGDGDNHIIDEVDTGDIKFIQNKAVISQADQELVVYGTCSEEQSGALISWRLFDAADVLLDKGKALCDKGAFEVSFEGLQELACGSKLRLDAFFGAQAQTSVAIDKNCL